MAFLWLRLPKKRVVLAGVIAVSICALQMIQLLKPIPAGNSPYTRWLSIDPFSFLPVIFFILLPLIASIPAGTLLKNDVDSGLFAKVKLQSSLQKVMWSYIGIAFLTGFAIITLALLLNFAFYFTVLPNIKPDNLLNSNILLINQSTLLVSLYYAHPLLHAAISILFASTWAGLFSVFVTVTAIWIKNAFVAMSLGLVAQIVVLMLNSFIKLPNSVSYSPADFLHEMAPTNVSLAVTGIVTLLMLIYCIAFSQIGVKHLVP
ncbi:hypothetical protein LACPH_002521 [Lacticaseibacillus parahuelsenbergensis]|uniref:ABC transporter permease n=1 Tax=Lacticaseibacillus parahuelsenbergensis TaxID=3068305 RepID=A0ABY9L239_9LACO|nr:MULTISPECIES: hypothetical protein [Lacticaseibacillus]MDE3283630.1 hypothetical protein [Lacticaseibacillus casei]WLV77744.1 hypothetical protein LACPH_002521 [Lacticaseibacillus sp. NCIMB 15471]